MTDDRNDDNHNDDNGNYLWDGSGEPDAETARLEELLGGLAYDGALPTGRPAASGVERASGSPPPGASPDRRPRRVPLILGLAAAAGLIGAAVWWFADDGGPARIGASDPWAESVAGGGDPAVPGLRKGWRVATTQGAPAIGEEALDGPGQLLPGLWLETDAASAARIEVANIGTLEVRPGSRLRLLHSHDVEHRIELAYGTIEAEVLAPPRLFVVQTPAATAVDLGCRYRLEVDEAGDGLLSVDTGWVALEDAGRDVRVPAGAECAMRKGSGPGTPVFVSAATAFRAAVIAFDRGEAVADSVELILTFAQPDDVLTLWHLLPRLDAAAQQRAVDLALGFAPAPSGVTREGLLRLDRRMLETWWDRMSRHW